MCVSCRTHERTLFIVPHLVQHQFSYSLAETGLKQCSELNIELMHHKRVSSRSFHIVRRSSGSRERPPNYLTGYARATCQENLMQAATKCFPLWSHERLVIAKGGPQQLFAC